MSELESGTVIDGKYRLDKLLGAGGMGAVWLGKHLSLDSLIAVKFMGADMLDDEMARARFEREAKAAARIRSSHVVHIYEHGVHDDMPYIVMEYLEGEDLSSKMKRECPLEPQTCARLCVEAAKGMHRAHQAGLIHRDLKPSNIFLSRPDGDMVKIIDFGIAKPVTPLSEGDPEIKTDSTVIVGSPWYMSPEQVRNMPLDARSDNWMLAVVLYEALTGCLPFGRSDIGSLLVAICMDPIPPPSTHIPELGPEVDAFFEKALSREREERHRDVREFAREFCEAMALAGRVSIRDSWFNITEQRETVRVGEHESDEEVSTASTRLDMMNHVGQAARRRRWLSASFVGFVLIAGIGVFATSNWSAPSDQASSGASAEVQTGRESAGTASPSAVVPKSSATPRVEAEKAAASATPSSSASSSAEVRASAIPKAKRATAPRRTTRKPPSGSVVLKPATTDSSKAAPTSTAKARSAASAAAHGPGLGYE